MTDTPQDAEHFGPKPFSRFDTDEEADHFVETADLSEYDFSEFRSTRFEFELTVARTELDQ
jgi:hypothetical protein